MQPVRASIPSITERLQANFETAQSLVEEARTTCEHARVLRECAECIREKAAGIRRDTRRSEKVRFPATLSPSKR